jgi:hypothetical protein
MVACRSELGVVQLKRLKPFLIRRTAEPVSVSIHLSWASIEDVLKSFLIIGCASVAAGVHEDLEVPTVHVPSVDTYDCLEAFPHAILVLEGMLQHHSNTVVL